MKDCILHNPRCTKSRATLKLLQDHGVELPVVNPANSSTASMNAARQSSQVRRSLLIPTDNPVPALSGRHQQGRERLTLRVEALCIERRI